MSAPGVWSERTNPDQVGDVARQDLGEADDRELVAEITRRDEAALAEAVRRHRGSVVAFARRLVGDHDRAEDIAQEVFLRLWERSERFDADAGRCARSCSRSRTVERSMSCGQTQLGTPHEERRHPNEHIRPGGGQAGHRPDGRRCRAPRPGAASRERAPRAVELAYFGGHSYRVVARLLDEPEGTVKSRIRSGLAKLRVMLAAQDLQGP